MGFWEQFWPQFVATTIGVGLGILGALWLSRYQEKREEKDRKEKILSSLHGELEENKDQLSTYLTHNKDDFKSGTLGVRLRDETWKAFSEGGELEWIKDVYLLAELSDAYYKIKVVKDLSEKHYNLVNYGRGGAGDYFDFLQDSAKFTKETIEDVIDEIEKRRVNPR